MATFLNPATVAAPASTYSHGVLTEAQSKLIHTAGTVGTLPDGTVPDAIGDQATAVWANIAAILAEGGFELSDVVSYTTYAVVGENLAAVMAARDRALAGHRPASTLIPVPALARPEWKVEITAVAARI